MVVSGTETRRSGEGAATKADYQALQKAADRGKIGKAITPHVFRHSFGTLLYDITEDPKAVQRLMRHRSLATTMKYVHDRRDLGDKVNSLPIPQQPENWPESGIAISWATGFDRAISLPNGAKTRQDPDRGGW